MNWAFCIFLLLFGFMLYLHFALAHRALRRLGSEVPPEIDLDYVRLEDYFGRSFRNKLTEWLQQTPAQALPGKHRIPNSSDTLRIAMSVESGSDTVGSDVLVVQGDFTCGSASVFQREVYVRGSARVGERSRMQALACDGSVTTGSDVQVLRWMDAAGAIQLGRGARIHSRVTSRVRIDMARGATAPSVFAPEIRTEGSAPPGWVEPENSGGSFTRIPPARESDTAGFVRRKLVELSADTWLYRGDLHPAAPLRLSKKLIVLGACTLPPGSILEGDLKVRGALVVGAGSVCHAHLVARGAIRLEPCVRFHGVIYSSRGVRLCAGVTGTADAPGVVVFASEGVELEEGVVLQGKLASARAVVVVPSSTSTGSPSVLSASQKHALFRSLAILGLISLGTSAAAADSPAGSDTAPFRLEMGGFANQVSNGFGYWRGADAQLWLRSNPRFIPALLFESQTRPTGTQQNYSFFSYLNWSKSFYTTQAISIAPQLNAQSIYYPKTRYDFKTYWKLPPGHNLVLAAGITRFDFGTPGRGQIYNLGTIYYARKWIVEGNLFVNRNQPGSLLSTSGSLGAQYGKEYSYWIGLSAGGGRELYRYVGNAVFDVNIPSYYLHGFYRRWITRHVGYVFLFDYVKKIAAYRQAGVSANLFFEL